MDGTYPIYSADHVVGTAWVRTEGLYYHFGCECEIPEKKLCKICVYSSDDHILLGTPIPKGERFVLSKKMPAKRFGAGQLRFALIDAAAEKEIFVPVRENATFGYMKHLKKARMQVRDGVAGVVLPQNVWNKGDFGSKKEN